jgi:hypothetical protein
MLPPIGQVHAAAEKLGSHAPYVDRELASILAVWLNSVHRRMSEGAPAPDSPYAIELAQLVLRRGLPRLDGPA